MSELFYCFVSVGAAAGAALVFLEAAAAFLGLAVAVVFVFLGAAAFFALVAPAFLGTLFLVTVFLD